MLLRIIVIRPSNGAHVLSFDSPGEILIGRGSACQCRLDFDPLVSRLHAMLEVADDKVTLRDLNSRNGVYLNGAQYGGRSKVKLTEPRVMANGDMVRVGDTTLSFLISSTDSAVSVDFGLLGRVRREADTLSASASAWAEFPPEAVAHQIPGYTIDGIIGSGGMGIVYHARRQAGGEQVAIKTMHPGMVVSDKMLVNFHREIEVTKKIDHPNIVKFHDSGTTVKDIMYLVLEYVAGGDLSKLMDEREDRRLAPPEAYVVSLQIAAGLAHAHSLGIVHRDVKPQNVLLERLGIQNAKISDLGLAKYFDDAGSSGFTGTAAGGGTVSYMPPEQLTEFRDIKPTGDVFSVGATMYEMLTGRVAYDFTGGDKIRAVAQAKIVPLRNRGAGLPDKLVQVVDKCLMPSPEDRYPDCGELLDALRRVAW